jgi:hypothetical protein
METVEYLELGGKLLAAWSSGYVSGFLIGFFRRLSEQV